MKKKRTTLEELIKMKKEILDRCIRKEMKCKEGAKILGMHEKAFSRMKRRYKEKGEEALMPKKTGPKGYKAHNRTAEEIEEEVEELARKHYDLGPVPLAEKLREEKGIRLHATTIWRILRRRKVRYRRGYKREKKKNAKLYCLGEPGEEVQVDGSYPFGRARKIVCFSAIDDCSRWAYGRIYDRETAENAIKFITELMRRVPFKIKRLRVDNRYGKKLKRYCKARGIEVITNDAYTPEQNGKVERYHRTLKNHFFWQQVKFEDDVETIEYKHQLWLHYYNEQRRHGGLGMNRMTPREKLALTSLLALSNVPSQKVTLTLQQNTI